jgi:hypothetical protein
MGFQIRLRLSRASAKQPSSLRLLTRIGVRASRRLSWAKRGGPRTQLRPSRGDFQVGRTGWPQPFAHGTDCVVVLRRARLAARHATDMSTPALPPPKINRSYLLAGIGFHWRAAAEKMRPPLGGEGRPLGGNLVSGEGRVTRTEQIYIELPNISPSILLRSFSGCAYFFWRSGAATLRSAQTPPGGT